MIIPIPKGTVVYLTQACWVNRYEYTDYYPSIMPMGTMGVIEYRMMQAKGWEAYSVYFGDTFGRSLVSSSFFTTDLLNIARLALTL